MKTWFDKKWMPFAVLILTAACGMNADDARKELTAIGERFDPASFVQAAATGDVRAVELFLLAGMDPDVVVPGLTRWSSRTAVGEAVSAEQSEVVTLLLDSGADASPGLPPAIRAEQFGVVTMLLDAGADPTVGIPTALSSRDLQMTETLLDAGANGMTAVAGWLDRAFTVSLGIGMYDGSRSEFMLLIDAWAGRGLEDSAEAILDALSSGLRCSEALGSNRRQCEADRAALRDYVEGMAGTP